MQIVVSAFKRNYAVLMISVCALACVWRQGKEEGREIERLRKSLKTPSATQKVRPWVVKEMKNPDRRSASYRHAPALLMARSGQRHFIRTTPLILSVPSMPAFTGAELNSCDRDVRPAKFQIFAVWPFTESLSTPDLHHQAHSQPPPTPSECRAWATMFL